MLNLPTRLNQFKPIDGSKYTMNGALEHFAPIFQEIYQAAGNPQTDREKLFLIRGLLRGYYFHSTGPTSQTKEEAEATERSCLEYFLLDIAGLIY